MPVLPLRIKKAEADRLGLLAVAADYGVNADLASALPMLALCALSARHPDDFVALSEDEMMAKVAAADLGYDL